MLVKRPQKWPHHPHQRPPLSPPVVRTELWGRVKERLTKQSVVPIIVRQEPFVDGAHQEMVRQAGGLGPHEEEARGHVDGLVGDGDQA